MARSISASVGKKGKNNPEDVKTVQQLLNPFASAAGFSKLKVDGEPTPQLFDAIGKFQRKVCHFKPDYLVQPRNTTINTLNAGVAKLEAEKKAAAQKAAKLRDEARKKLIAEAKKAAEKEAKSAPVEKGLFAELLQDVEDFAMSLYDKYFAEAEKKGEPPEKAAPKIAKIVSKQTQKKAALQAAKAAEANTSKTASGKVTGKTAGVNKTILNILNEVSAHYDTPIKVVSGKRDKKGQASAMYGGWNSHLKNGKIYVYLRNNEKLRLELDALRQKKDKTGFINHMMKKADWKQVSRHLTGDAADITVSTDAKIIAAIGTCLKYLAEKNSDGIKCHHFDTRKVVWPIPDTVKAKWKT